MNRRARRAVLVAILALFVVGAAMAGGAWYVFGEARRTGRLVAGVLSARTGLPITVARASVNGTRLRLSDVRVAGLPMELRVANVEVAGGVLPLVIPAGRRVSVVAMSVSVEMGAEGRGAPDAVALESLRASLRALLDWPGTFGLRVESGEWRGSDAVQPFSLEADKDSGALTVALALGPASRPPVLRANIRATAVGTDGVGAGLDLAGEPARLGVRWPEGLSTPASLAARAEVQLVRAGDLTARGRLTAGDVAGPPMVVDFASHYDAAHRRLSVSHYALDWGPDLHLAGQGETTAGRDGVALQASGRGMVEGSPMSGRGAYHFGTGAFEAEVNLDSVDGRRLGRRLGLAALPEATARRLVARMVGPGRGAQPMATLAVRADAVATSAAPTFAVDAMLDARLRLIGARPAAVETATLALARGGGPLALARLASPGATLWPLTIDARIDDLGRLGPLLPKSPTLSGWARIVGNARAGERLDFDGTLEAQVPRVQLMAGGPVTMIDMRVRLPIVGSDREDVPPGSVTVARVAGWGVALTDLASTARLSGPRLLLPDIHYVQYGGRGRGWLEAFLDGRPVPVRARLEGEGIDLAGFVREAGWRVAHITGHVRYVAAAQFERGGGFTAAVRLHSENGGGEVGVEAVERLLDSATVQAETSGVLRQTLENLRVFQYESMEGDLRVQGTDGHVDLSLRGRKRLGIFPAAVEAINFRNVPLSVLARTLGRSDP